VGAALGATNGKVVGAAVGDVVGSTVGVALGSALGAAVGDVVGAAVGDVVGTADSAAVGDVVGAAVGETVGSNVGSAVAVAIGLKVVAVGDCGGGDGRRQMTLCKRAIVREVHVNGFVEMVGSKLALDQRVSRDERERGGLQVNRSVGTRLKVVGRGTLELVSQA
jgi:hypothetical protein